MRKQKPYIPSFDRKVNWDMWNAVAAIALFLATIGLIVVGVLQFKTSNRYVNLVNQQLDIQRKDFELVNRPIVQPILNPTGDLKAGSIIFQNIGRLPAENVFVIWEFREIEANDPAYFTDNKANPFFAKEITAGKWFAVEYDSKKEKSDHHCFLIVSWAFSRDNSVNNDSMVYHWNKNSKIWGYFPTYKRKNLEEAHRVFLQDKEKELRTEAVELNRSR